MRYLVFTVLMLALVSVSGYTAPAPLKRNPYVKNMSPHLMEGLWEMQWGVQTKTQIIITAKGDFIVPRGNEVDSPLCKTVGSWFWENGDLIIIEGRSYDRSMVPNFFYTYRLKIERNKEGKFNSTSFRGELTKVRGHFGPAKGTFVTFKLISKDISSIYIED